MGFALGEQLRLFRVGPSATTPPAVARQTEHLIRLGPRVIEFRVRRAPHRRLSMTIDDHGLRVSASVTLPLAQIEAFIRHHGAWVIDKLAARDAAPRAQKLLVSDGMRIPVLANVAELRVLPGHNRIRWIGDTLLLEARGGADLNTLARRGLQQRALDHFQRRLQHFAPQLGVSAPPLGLSAARTRWGSCSQRSGIRLNWRLIHLAPELGDYVVVHELAHLHEMNHSPRFWGHVERACPDWRRARDELKRHALTLPLL